ncbi:hypothetical protein ACGFS9_09185 [Streptomyces sp. NPDC048566]|uniref:hypothetical protein n=1 Tax=Streptomyces sp. NPDC048566 TaxID=3365569 RepID=UPI003719FDC7
MFKRNPDKAAARAARREVQHSEEAALKTWRAAHLAEKELNQAALLHLWPRSRQGMTPLGPIQGGSAEFFDADAHKAWTATRLIAGATTMGTAAIAAGRKNKGAAAINIRFGNGAVQSFTVKPDPTSLRAANRYVTAFNALAAQLATEGPPASDTNA